MEALVVTDVAPDIPLPQSPALSDSLAAAMATRIKSRRHHKPRISESVLDSLLPSQTHNQSNSTAEDKLGNSSSHNLQPADIPLPPSPRPSRRSRRPRLKITIGSSDSEEESDAPTTVQTGFTSPTTPTSATCAPSASVLGQTYLATAPTYLSNTIAQPTLIRPGPMSRHRSLDDLARSYNAKFFGSTPMEQRLRSTNGNQLVQSFAAPPGVTLMHGFMKRRMRAMSVEGSPAALPQFDTFEEDNVHRLTPLQEVSAEESNAECSEHEAKGGAVAEDSEPEQVYGSVMDGIALHRPVAVADMPAAKRAEIRRGKQREAKPRSPISERASSPDSKEDSDTAVTPPVLAAAPNKAGPAANLPSLKRVSTQKGKQRATAPRVPAPEIRGRSMARQSAPSKKSSQSKLPGTTTPDWESASDSDSPIVQRPPRSPRLQAMFDRMPRLTRQPRRRPTRERSLSPLDFSKRPIPMLWRDQDRYDQLRRQAQEVPTSSDDSDDSTTQCEDEQHILAMRASPPRHATPPAIRRTHSSPPPMVRRASIKAPSPSATSMISQGMRKVRRVRARTSVTRYRGDLPVDDGKAELARRREALEVVRAIHAARMAAASKEDESDLEATDVESITARPSSKQPQVPDAGQSVSGCGNAQASFLSPVAQIPALDNSQTSNPDSPALLSPHAEASALKGLAILGVPELQTIKETASQGSLTNGASEGANGAEMLLCTESSQRPAAATAMMSDSPSALPPQSEPSPALSNDSQSIKSPSKSFYASLSKRLGSLASNVKQLSIRTDRRSASTNDLQRVVERPVDIPEADDTRRLPTGAVGWMKDKELWKADFMSDECDYLGCHSPFTVRNRRHHCRSCGGIFCQEHSFRTLPLAVPVDAAHPAARATVQDLRCCTLCWDLVYNPGFGADRDRWPNGKRSSSEERRAERAQQDRAAVSPDGRKLTGMQRLQRAATLSSQGHATSSPVTLGSELFDCRRQTRAQRVPLGRFQTDPTVSQVRDIRRMTPAQARQADPGYQAMNTALSDYPLSLPRTHSRTNITTSPGAFSPLSPASRVESLLSLSVLSPASSNAQLSRSISQSPLRSPTMLLTPPPPVIDENGQMSIANLISTENALTAGDHEDHSELNTDSNDDTEFLLMRQSRKAGRDVLVVDGDIRYRANLPIQEPEPETETGPRRSIFPEMTF